MLSFDARGGEREIRSFTDWRTSWTAIVSSGFPRAAGVRGLFASDRAAGYAATFEIDPFGVLQELRTYSGWRKSWSSFAAIGTDGILATNQAPLPTPTPTPAPTPSPAPTPAIVPADRVTIRLEPGRGDDWARCTANVGEPRIGGTRQGYITAVRNTCDRRIALTYRDRSGNRTGPVVLKAGETLEAFDGRLVAGEWEAAVTGSRAVAPARISLDVRFEPR